jgi:hypothetical protein
VDSERGAPIELTSVEYTTKKLLPFRDTPIIPLGDIQLQPNRDTVDIKRLKRVIAWGVENDARYLGMGDYVDMESPSNRERLAGAGYYDSVRDALDLQAEQLEGELQEILAPTKGKWLGLIEGHHYHVHQDGSTSDTRLAKYLGCPFLGTAAYIRVAFESKSHVVKPGFTIWLHHGRGGGKLLSTPLNQLEHVIKGFEADVYLVGHHHKANAARHSRIYPKFGAKRGWLEHRDVFLATTGSFLKGYLEGHKKEGRPGGLYPERGMMNPVSLGNVIIWARPHWSATERESPTRSGSPTVDISVEV